MNILIISGSARKNGFCDYISKNLFTALESLNNKEKNNVKYYNIPANETIYNNRKDYFDENSFEEVKNEVWQIFDDFDNLETMGKYGTLDVELVKTNDMKKVAIINDECFSTGDEEDPYGSLDKGYIDIYENYNESADSKYKREFYFVKVNGEIVGVTVSVYGDGICGIYGLAVKKEYRKKGIGKEALRQQLKICKNKNVDIAFLQTEEGFYPANIYRKFGFKDVCNAYYYVEK